TIQLGVPVVFPRGYIPGRGTQTSLHIRPVKFITDESWSENVGPSTRVAGSWTGRSGERNRRIRAGPIATSPGRGRARRGPRLRDRRAKPRTRGGNRKVSRGRFGPRASPQSRGGR